jgi:hypothetical protein
MKTFSGNAEKYEWGLMVPLAGCLVPKQILVPQFVKCLRLDKHLIINKQLYFIKIPYISNKYGH